MPKEGIPKSWNRLQSGFYQREDTIGIAKECLSKILVSTVDGVLTAGRIIEVEAYLAPEDKASHAYGNRRTNRTEIMFAKGGLAYVYLCYGIHQMFNIVCGKEGSAHAILVRSVQPILGKNHMLQRRNFVKEINLVNGPGKLCQAMGIGRVHNAIDLCHLNSEIGLYNDPESIDFEIEATPRIGIDYAEEWKDEKLRFVMNEG